MTGPVAQSTNGPQAGGDRGPLLEVHDLVVHYHIRGRARSSAPTRLSTPSTGSAFRSAATKPWAWWRERLRQVDHGPHRALPGTPDVGTVRFEGRDLSSLRAGALKDLRRHMQIVFQDPVGALNPGTPWASSSLSRSCSTTWCRDASGASG